MAKTDFKSVDDYLASLPPATQQVLSEVRAAIREALPQAEEVISYQIPAYRVGKARVIYFAGWARHWSLYPLSGAQTALIDAPEGVEVAKGTIRFPLDAPVPVDLVKRIAKLRAEAEGVG